MKRYYFDNAATSYPKPQTVITEMMKYFSEIGSSPGRGGYELGIEAGRIVFNTRNNIKKLFNAPSEENVVFTPNVTYALNMVFLGILKPNDHVITTSMEHNSVIRPLRYLEKSRKIDLTIVKCDSKGQLDPMDIKRAIRKNTKIIVMTHASNITGGIAPIEHISKIKEETGAYFVLDCAQTAGVLDIDFKKLQLDFLAFTGHKGLYGPPGTGGLILSDIAADEIVPLIHGGTGSKSDMEYQPDFMPDKMEAGTPNTIGIAGLYAGLNFVNEKGIKTIREHQTKLTKIFMEGLKELPRVRVFGQEEPDKRVAVVSIDVRGADLGELAYRLDNDYKIMIRSGLHCAPLAHKTIGTYPKGTLRFSFGSFNTEQEIMYCLKSLKEIIQKS